LPLGYLLAFILEMDAMGIWFGLLAGLTVSAVLLTVRFYFLIKKIKLDQPKIILSSTSSTLAH